LAFQVGEDTAEFRNGANPYTLEVYNTYTDASNYERGVFKWDTDELILGTEALGTGSSRQLRLDGGTQVRFSVNGVDQARFVGGEFHPVTSGVNNGRGSNPWDITISNEFHSYNLYTDASNYERSFQRWVSNAYRIGVESLGSGSSRFLEIWAAGSVNLACDANQNISYKKFIPSATSTIDLGRTDLRWLNAYIDNIYSYNTYTDASNYERGVFKWDTNELVIGTESLGTGTDRALRFLVNGIDYGGITINGRWQLGAGAGNSADVNIGGANILHFKDSATAFIDTGVSSALQLRPQGVVAMRLNTDQSIDVYERMTIFGTNVASSSTIPPFSITKTYNQTATAGSTDLLINRTETALGSGDHYLIDAQVGGTSAFSVDNAGTIYSASGLYDSDAATIQFKYSGAAKLQINSTAVTIRGNFLRFHDSGGTNLTNLVPLANSLEQRNSTNPQEFLLSNTYTNGSNYERGALKWDTNRFTIATEELGTGVARDIALEPGTGTVEVFSTTTTSYLAIGTTNTGRGASNGLTVGYNESVGGVIQVREAESLTFGTSDSTRWRITAGGDFQPVTDGSFDIGQSSLRVLDYFGTNGDFSGDVTVSGAINQQTSSAADPTIPQRTQQQRNLPTMAIGASTKTQPVAISI
jgi:hypothetical protein